MDRLGLLRCIPPLDTQHLGLPLRNPAVEIFSRKGTDQVSLQKEKTSLLSEELHVELCDVYGGHPRGKGSLQNDKAANLIRGRILRLQIVKSKGDCSQSSSAWQEQAVSA